MLCCVTTYDFVYWLRVGVRVDQVIDWQIGWLVDWLLMWLVIVVVCGVAGLFMCYGVD